MDDDVDRTGCSEFMLAGASGDWDRLWLAYRLAVVVELEGDRDLGMLT